MSNEVILQGCTVDDIAEAVSRTLSNQLRPANEQREFLDVEQAAEFLNISVPTIHRLKAKDKIPFRKIGSRVIYSRTDLTKWIMNDPDRSTKSKRK